MFPEKVLPVTVGFPPVLDIPAPEPKLPVVLPIN
jgi:hypothetical protein